MSSPHPTPDELSSPLGMARYVTPPPVHPMTAFFKQVKEEYWWVVDIYGYVEPDKDFTAVYKCETKDLGGQHYFWDFRIPMHKSEDYELILDWVMSIKPKLKLRKK